VDLIYKDAGTRKRTKGISKRKGGRTNTANGGEGGVRGRKLDGQVSRKLRDRGMNQHVGKKTKARSGQKRNTTPRKGLIFKMERRKTRNGAPMKA